jgi:hypothetical protein
MDDTEQERLFRHALAAFDDAARHIEEPSPITAHARRSIIVADLIASGMSEADAMALYDSRLQEMVRAIANTITAEFERQGRPVYEVGDTSRCSSRKAS